MTSPIINDPISLGHLIQNRNIDNDDLVAKYLIIIIFAD